MVEVRVLFDRPGFPDVGTHKADTVPLAGECIEVDCGGKAVQLEVVRSSIMPDEASTFIYYDDWAICREAV